MPARSSTSPDPLACYGRIIDLMGQEAFEQIQRAFVIVIGLGGVGSHAAIMLVRTGVGRLRIIDFDQITWSSLNRSAFARSAEVGQSKARVLEQYLHGINPDLEIEAVEAFYHHDTEEALLSGAPHYVVDAIDSVNPKIALLRACVERRIPVISCMGSAGHTDPTQLRIGDLSETRICPLARVMRKNLRRVGITSGITAIYSLEPPRGPLPPDVAEETLRRGRVRNRLPSLGIIPGIVGYCAAGVVISALQKQ